ncbi:acid phosphatase [Methylobacterium radiodurans]|uniref:Acid phosphatase n=1 Tax=Methylobacterium radiodurans TaxID=2202828 RepID=A0A2U8VMN1_9HYPH|nr:phosphatase PAP2 family protein [Methylobacterium radiodurans]AWN34939.1 acid phosphatase [Methylobacterium radiodurans]
MLRLSAFRTGPARLALALSTASLLASLPARAEPPKPAMPPETAAPGPQSAPSVGVDTLKPGKPAAKPYLSEAAAPDTVKILSPPPASHSPLENADRAAFNTTRGLKGSPRWDLAASDVAEGASAILDTYACVLGTKIDAARVPAVINLFERARLDIARGTKAPKLHYRRLRPFVGNDAPICVQRTQQLTDSFSYPSGHATQGWSYALMMAALVPEKTSAILARGRVYGESRIVCGVHWLTDVAAGRTNGAAIFAALMGSADFRADMDKARAELAKALDGKGPAPAEAICTRENDVLAAPALQF